MEFFRVTNWDQYQHYKDRDPAWIKLYARLLDDYAFATLPDTTKWHLVGIFLLASKQGNRIPGDARWVQKKIAARTRVDLNALLAAGFIEEDASTVLAEAEQVAIPEKESESEERRERLLSAGADPGNKVVGATGANRQVGQVDDLTSWGPVRSGQEAAA